MPPANPCSPSPCGPNSECRVINNQAVCSCVRGYLGSPPTCRPECVVSTDCPQNEACSNQRCTNPCPGSCGIGALCHVVNHNPICICPSSQTGDPFVRCISAPRKYRALCPLRSPGNDRSSFRFIIHRALCPSSATTVSHAVRTVRLRAQLAMPTARRLVPLLVSA